MNLNGITNAVHSNDKLNSEKLVKNTADKTKSSAADVAVIYEHESPKGGKAGKTYSRDEKTISALKEEVEKRTAKLRDIVEQIILKQGQKFSDVTDIYELLREGRLDVDPQTAARAQEEISESGYWGVEQTSERLFQFAFSLAGGDPAKAQEMKDAFINGYKEAEKAWGGELPEISRKTYEATLKKFDEWTSE